MKFGARLSQRRLCLSGHLSACEGVLRLRHSVLGGLFDMLAQLLKLLARGFIS